MIWILKLNSWENSKTFGFLCFSFHFKNLVYLFSPPNSLLYDIEVKSARHWILLSHNFTRHTMCPLKKVYPFFHHFKNWHIVQLEENLVDLRWNKWIYFKSSFPPRIKVLLGLFLFTMKFLVPHFNWMVGFPMVYFFNSVSLIAVSIIFKPLLIFSLGWYIGFQTM